MLWRSSYDWTIKRIIEPSNMTHICVILKTRDPNNIFFEVRKNYIFSFFFINFIIIININNKNGNTYVNWYSLLNIYAEIWLKSWKNLPAKRSPNHDAYMRAIFFRDIYRTIQNHDISENWWRTWKTIYRIKCY